MCYEQMLQIETVKVEKMRFVLTIMLLFTILFLAALLITAYVITPIISWLVVNPLGGIVLLVIVVVLASVLVREEMKEDKKD
jgi:hypothetical protein